MINIDYDFKNKVNYDTVETDTGIRTSVASINTREVQKEEQITTVPMVHIDKAFKMDMQPFINRPFFLESVVWDTSKAKFSLLNVTRYKLPQHIITSNTTLLNGLKVGTLYRMAGKLNVSVAGTITHSGCVLVGILPPLQSDIDYSLSQEFLINTILSGPHGFLFANEATSIMLDIPWYCNTDLDSLNVDSAAWTALNLNETPANCATLVMMVINPLQPSTGSSTSLTIVTEANLTNLEVYVPSPQYATYQPQSYFTNLGTGLLDSAAKYAKKLTGDAIDGLRAGVRAYTGLHNPNVPPLVNAHLVVQRNRLNNIDVPSYLENLDPNANFSRVVREPIFNTLEDEMAIGHLIKKRQYIATFRVNQSDPVGKLLFARPISPYQGGMRAATGNVAFTPFLCNNLELLHFLTRAWKGTIKIHIQAVMNNKQQVKLRLLQLYNPSKAVMDAPPVYNSILQAPSHLLEFSAGGQEQVVELPYLSRNKLMMCARDSLLEPLLHGVYYLYVAQPLANSADSPADIFFNVYMSLGEDFSFHGYSTELCEVNGPRKVSNILLSRVPRDVPDQPPQFPEEGHALAEGSSEDVIDVVANHAKKFSSDSVDLIKTEIRSIGGLRTSINNSSISETYTPQSIIVERKKQRRNLIVKWVSRFINCICSCIEAWNEDYDKDKYIPQSIDVMNQPQKQVSENDGKIHLATDTRIQPLVDIRPIIRRLYPTEALTLNVGPTAVQAATIRLNRYLGESSDFTSTPAIAISRMYYGKEAGIKMRVRMRVKSGTLHSVNTKFYYVPPQMYPKVNVGSEAIVGASIATLNDGFKPETIEYPLTNITVHAIDAFHYIYEFTIPNTSILKFIGGPRKMDYSPPEKDYFLASSDMGYLMIIVDTPNPTSLTMYLEAALTDESRLGFHCIAPVIERQNQGTNILLTSATGAREGPASYPTLGPNGNVYLTRF